MPGSNTSLVERLLAKVDHCLLLAEHTYKQAFPYQAVHINIRGRAAGQVRFEGSSTSLNAPMLRFNPVMLNQYKTLFIDEVVPHECAHLVVHRLYRTKPKCLNKVKPHGFEWQKVMRELYHLEPRVTHRFETIKPKRDNYLYDCACSGLVHRLSVIRHNKVMREQSVYHCKMCSDRLIFSGQKEVWR